MGNLVKMCGCDNDDESKYIKTDYDPLALTFPTNQ